MTESHSLFLHTEDPEGIIAVLGQLCYTDRQLDPERPVGMAEEALALARELDAPLLIATSLALLGAACYKAGQHERAWSCLEEGLSLTQLLQNRLLEAQLLNNLAINAAYEGQNERSLELLQRSVRLHEQIGLESGAALSSQENLGRLALRMGEWETARIHFEETAAMSRRANNKFMLARCDEGLGQAWYHLGDFQQARRSLRAAISMPDLWSAELMKISISETMVRILLAEEAYADAATVLCYRLHHYPSVEYVLFDAEAARSTVQRTLGRELYEQLEQDAPEQDIEALLGRLLR